ncbi:hypothetical protein SGPA1_10696 [Streptomyces misionensis JCM 4497]
MRQVPDPRRRGASSPSPPETVTIRNEQGPTGRNRCGPFVYLRRAGDDRAREADASPPILGD